MKSINSTDLNPVKADSLEIGFRGQVGERFGFEISAYPNPFNPVLNILIKSDRPQVGTLEAWTSQGRLAASIWSGLLHQGINKTKWNAEHFPSGTYHIRLKTAETTKTYTCVLLK